MWWDDAAMRLQVGAQTDSSAAFELFGYGPEALAAIAAVASAFAAVCSLAIALAAPSIVDRLSRRGRLLEMKVDCFRRMMGLRSQPARIEWLQAVQEVPALFHRSRPVMEAYDAYCEEPEPVQTVALLQAIAHDLRIRGLTEASLLTVFNPT